MSLRIIFICSGNICRSPMAEAIARDRLEAHDLSGVVISAGTLGIVGRSAAAHAVQALEEIDLDISDHRSQGISTGLLERADYLPIMTPRHGRQIIDRYDRARPKIVELWQYGEAPALEEGITDPVGEDLETFRRCRDHLVTCIEGWLSELDPD